MGLGTHNTQPDINQAEQGFLQACNEKQNYTYNEKKEPFYKCWSTTVPMKYVVIGATGGTILVIILSTVIAVQHPAEILSTICVQCKDGWILYKNKCYYFSDNYRSWDKSLEFCKSQNSSLAIIDNTEELAFLNRFKGIGNHWIGLSRKEDDSGWVWTNGTLYFEDIFQIERLAGNLERVYLNHDGVKSNIEKGEKKWICSHYGFGWS
ncbi:C-type lectin domain family 2 member A-like [Pyxicephalus adspersus]|uniref:C-type lectin domain-containing protein n=1 Tax=Pyxicephalus adspersus TaxID=30357 RepID=A0AAV2ZM05_PYXAD|nr:TPA: hypothetical protein GDO54_004155 [Pyxicephalus adspersus]